MPNAIVKVYDYNYKTQQPELTYALRVFAAGGFEVIESRLLDWQLEKLRHSELLAGDDFEKRVTPADGIAWAEALVRLNTRSYTSATIEEEAA